VEFRDEDRWGGDSSRFLQQRAGYDGFTLGRIFEFLAYSTSALRDHPVWFASPFRDPAEGYVIAEKIRASLARGLFQRRASTRRGSRRRSPRQIPA
jgi:RNA-dependent RNA polymerase